MQAILTGDARAGQLRPGVQRAIASSDNDAALAVELELVSILDGPAFQGSARSRAFLRFVVEEALAAHYEAVAPKGAIRIELPCGSYAPKFTAVAVPTPAEERPRPPAMLFWQLAAPTLVAVFLALVAIRSGAESSDAFSRFWDRAMVGRSGITVVLDAEAGGSISPAMADAALPVERLSESLQVPVHVKPAADRVDPGSYVIRLSLKEKPRGAHWFHVGPATAALVGTGDRVLWLWAETPEALRSAARMLTTRSGFPEIQ